MNSSLDPALSGTPRAAASRTAAAPLLAVLASLACVTALALGQGQASYTNAIAPILAERCGSCHGAERDRGGLRLHTPEAIRAGGASGPALEPGQPEASEIIRRLQLPLDDFEHMPPETQPQPSAGEIAAIEAWIAAGVPFDGAVAGREPSAAPPAAEPEFPDVPPPDASAIAAIRAELGHVEPLAAGTNALRVELAAIAPTVDAARAARLLEPLREQIVDLSLARAAIDDATIALLARMPNLVRLDLRRTRVTDAGLARLGAHPRLETLVLAGSAVTDAAVETLRGMSALRRVYLWGSCMTGDGTARLRALRPDLLVDAGDVPDATPLETEPPIALSIRPASP